MNIIFQKAYSYLLIQDENSWYVTYFTGGPVEIDICVKLNEGEILQVSGDQKALEFLIKKFKSDRSSYEGRRVVPSVTGGNNSTTPPVIP